MTDDMTADPNKAKQRIGATLTHRKQLQVDYWGELRRLMWSRDGSVRPRKPLPQFWQGFAIGRTHFKLVAEFHVDENYVSAGLSLTGENAKAHFALLEKDKEEIERELSKTLNWCEKPDTEYSYIVIFKDSYDHTNRDAWAGLLEWQYESLEDLHRVFAPRIKALDASDYRPGEADFDEDELV